MSTRFFVPLLMLVTLTACQTSSLTQEQQEPITESDTEFSGTKEIDMEKSSISFIGQSNIIDHQGKFNAYTVEITPDATNPNDLERASIRAEIDITSIEVDAPGLQGHLAKDDFFAAEQFPNAIFTSSSIVKKESNIYEVTGDLTVKGVTKTISFDAEITDDYFKANFDLPRKDFDIGNDAYGNKLLEPTVPVTIQLVFNA